MQQIGRLQKHNSFDILVFGCNGERDHVGIHHWKNLIGFNCLQQRINYFLGFYGCTPGGHWTLSTKLFLCEGVVYSCGGGDALNTHQYRIQGTG